MKNLKIFTDNIEEKAKEQIDELLMQEAFQDSKIRIMPDVHAGKGCVVGFTGNLGDKVIPNIVGVDIGCGIYCANLGKVKINFQKLDKVIRENVPSGRRVNIKKQTNFDLEKLYCHKWLSGIDWIEKSLGSLGGGNHFIEIDEDEDKNRYLVIHTGSRNLGTQVAKYYQDMADKTCNSKIFEYLRKREELIKKYKELGKEKEIQKNLEKLSVEFKAFQKEIPYEFVYLEKEERDAYLHDMKICQEFAIQNRLMIAKKIAECMDFDISDYFESVHNYIAFDDNIVRKGAISAKVGERVIIPMNMRDGCIIGVGKGNEDWNNSAPHGAGRILSRTDAKKVIKLKDYEESMKNIYTTSINNSTIDEAPAVYKPMKEIIKYIEPTVEITKIIKPIYNFKANE